MKARLKICDVCGEVEDRNQGGAFYTFRYKKKCVGFTEHKKLDMCHSCFTKMLDFCRGNADNETLEFEKTDA